MLVKVKSMSGRELAFDVAGSVKVGELKQLIEQKVGIASDQLKLLFNGRPMKDDGDLEYHHVGAGSVLHVVLNLHGGK